MAIIAVAGRKGGIGKSTIVGNLAGEFSAMGRTVRLLDADPQHSLAEWARQGEGVLSRSIEKVNPAETDELQAKARKAEKKADLVLIDTPPGMPETTYEAALVADLMLLPCGPSPLDLFALKETLALALKARAERRSKRPRVRFVPRVWSAPPTWAATSPPPWPTWERKSSPPSASASWSPKP